MAPSKLKAALAREKGVDYNQIKQKKKEKEAIKNKRKRSEKNGGAAAAAAEDSEGWEDEDQDSDEGGSAIVDENDEDEDEEAAQVDWQALDDSDSSGSEVELEEKIERRSKPKSILKAKNAAAATTKSKKVADVGEDEEDEEEEDVEEDEDEEEEDEEDIPISDLEDLPEEDREDLVPHTRLTINNTTALLASLHRIAITTDGTVPFATHQCVVNSGAAPTADGIEDVQDDLGRELAFYGQSLAAARRGRALLRAEGVPFSRPTDYFAEMVKDDGHMERVKAKLIEEASAKKASAEARKLRDLKKFGKQVQVAKLQERQKEKRDTLEKIKTLKRKRQESSNDVGATEADLFDVGVESELSAHKQRSGGKNSSSRDQRQQQPNAKRMKKNEKFGFGGKKRHAKSGDAVSTGDMSSFSARRMKDGGSGGVRGGGGRGGGRGGSGAGRGGRGGGSGRGRGTTRLGKSRRTSTR